jgi:cytochrome c553
MRHVQNTIMVLAVTVLMTGAVYSGVTALGGTSIGATSAGAGTIQTCPATGCSSAGCHATDGTSSAQNVPSTTDGYGTNGQGRGWGRHQDWPGTGSTAQDTADALQL